MTLDNLRKIVYDPAWNPAEEARLLAELDTAIGQVVRNILGVDIGFVQDGLRAFYLTSKQAHDWRMRLKAEVDRIELEMLERQDDERQSLWWVNEIVLGILFEPLDWLFTARDLLQGDLTALIGFLPLVPSALRHIVNAATGVGRYGGEIATSLEYLGEFDKFQRGYVPHAPYTGRGIDPFWQAEVYPHIDEDGFISSGPNSIWENMSQFEDNFRDNKYGVLVYSERFEKEIWVPIEFAALYDPTNH